MARREYASFIGERRRDITFTDRGRDPTRWILLVLAVATIGVSTWWFGFREGERALVTERVLNDTTIPTLLTPAVIESSGAEDAEVSLECTTVVEDWNTFQGGPERTGCLTTRPIETPRILWRTEVGITGWRNSPVVDAESGAVYVGSAGVVQFTRDRRDGIYSLDLRTGQQRWLFSTELDVNSVAVSGDTVIGVGDEGRVWALRARDGIPIWQDDLGVGVFGDPLFVGDEGDHVVITDGNGEVWQYDVATGNKQRLITLEGIIRGGASSDGEHIFVATDQGDVVALTMSGQISWRVSLEPQPDEEGVAVFAAPTVTDEYVILSIVRPDLAADPGLRALDKETGEQVWASLDQAALKTSWANLRSSVAVAGDYVIFGEGYFDQMVVVDIHTGVTSWAVPVGAFCYPHWPSPVINNGVAYLARHDGGLYAIDLDTREEKWRIYLGDADGSGVFPPSHSESDFCLWGPEDGYSILSSPAVTAEGTVILGTLEGYLLAIGDPNVEG